jgi:formiminoglutamase
MTGDDPLDLWHGRADPDGETGRRWHEIVRPFAEHPQAQAVLLGFACDEGVRRNHGRPGAAKGPAALRRMASTLPAWPGLQIADGRDVRCDDTDLESAQARQAERVAAAIERGALPIGIGGGHEIAYATYRGILQSKVPSGRKIERLGILNFDAHFDLRRDQRATSGTPFLQALVDAAGSERSVSYRVLGISETANTQALFDTARRHNVQHVLDTELLARDLAAQLSELAIWMASIDALHLSFCLDVLPQSVAPGVSAPAARGVGLDLIEPLLVEAAGSGKLVAADIAELNPAFDRDSATARVAARLLWLIVRSALRARGNGK